MTTEQKIREAFEKYKAKTIFPESVCEEDFRAGYLSLLNSLDQFGYAYCYQGVDICFSTEPQESDIPTSYYWQEMLYRLPEGVEK